MTMVRDRRTVILLLIFFTFIAIFLYLWGSFYSVVTDHGFTHESFAHTPFFVFDYFQPNEQLNILLVTALVSMFVVTIPIAAYFHGVRMRNLHGSAHWASEAEIQKSNLRSEHGILIGKKRTLWSVLFKMNYLCVGGNEHVMVYAPSGSGKGVGIAIVNCLTWRDSMLVVDIKKENFKKTSGFRAKFQKVFLWDPTSLDGTTHRYNPLSFVPQNKLLRINYIQILAHILYKTQNDKGEPWQPSARSMFMAIVLYLMDTPGMQVTLGAVLRTVKRKDFDKFLEGLVEHRPDLDPLCVANFSEHLQKAYKEQSGVKTTLSTGLELWENPLIDAATSQTDFDFSRMRKERMTIYVGIPANDIGRLAPLVNIFFQHALFVLTQNEPGKDERYKVLALLDEFPVMGRIPVLEKGVAFLRSYLIRLLPIIQGKSQLVAVYGEANAEAFLDNTKIRVAFAPNNLKVAQEISGSLGTKTVVSTGKTFNNNPLTGHITTSVSKSYMKRDLMLPHEVMQLKDSDEIIMIEANAPVKAKKITYYKDRYLRKRELPPVKIPRIDLERFISIGESCMREEGKVVPTKEEGNPYESLSAEKLDELYDIFEEGGL